MSKSRTIQSNMTAGAIAPTLAGRIDIDKYYNGLSTAENVVILPHGGVRRRPGLSKVTDSYVGEDARIEAFVFSATQSYLILFTPLKIRIYKDGVLKSTEVSPYSTIDEIRDIDVIQSADTMILVHEDYAPQQLQRQGSDTSWLLSLIVFSNIPKFNFDGITPNYINTGTSNDEDIVIDDIVYNNDGNSVKGADFTYYKSLADRSIDLSTEDYTNLTYWTVESTQTDVWTAIKGWPRTATFHQGRLWFGGSRDKVNSIWGSVVNDFFNFSVGTGQADESVFDTLDTDQYNEINGIFSGRNLQVFTAGGEFYNSSKIITPSDSSWLRQTSYGAKKEKPISVDGSTLFVDSSGRTIRQFMWSFNEDSYISINASLLSSHLLTDVKSMATIRGTATDLSDFVYVVNEDGTVAVMNSMRHEDIKGWTQWTTQGTFEDVAVVDKVAYFLVKRNTDVYIEKLTEGTHTDHNVMIEGTKPEEFNVSFSSDNVVFGSDNVVYADTALGVPVSTITTNYKEALLTPILSFKVIADTSIQGNADFIIDGTDLNHVDISRDAYSIEVGLDYDVVVKTMPLNVNTSENGAIVDLRKRVNRVILHLNESLGVFVMHNYLSDRQFPVVLDTAPEPFTGLHEIYLFGYTDRLVEVTITQQNPLPFILLGIDSEIEH